MHDNPNGRSRKPRRVGNCMEVKNMQNLEERFKNMHLLDREERMKLTKELEILRPEFMKPFVPKWWWWKRCVVNVLIVCDGILNYDMGGFGLSEFLTTFNQLEANYPWIDYRVTLAHRGAIINNPNPVVVNHIPNFNFATSVTLSNFDQVWLFGFNTFSGITLPEKSAIATYMNGGGGLFATGDHGYLGDAMCGDIVRVKDMRYWTDTPVGSTTNTNEVSMGGKRRNDTNRPAAGNSTSIWFDNQSDEIPQTIGVRTFGSGLPHPLLSIPTSLRPSGIIDIMPDHPHEGECKPETSFTVNNITVPTQIIATSFVLGGSTTSYGNKALTDPHCFPSISVWDGKIANVGRIVVDSTWHHFVNVNLNGVGSNYDKSGIQSGLNTNDFAVIRRYFMNIAIWMTRQPMLCWYRWIIFDLFYNSQLIEANLNNPTQKINEISLTDLNSIGSLAEEILATKYSPAFARSFLLDVMGGYNKNFSEILNVWKPDTQMKDEKKTNGYYQASLNLDLILWTSIGSGFIALRDNKNFSPETMGEKELETVLEVFTKGMDFGYNASVKEISSDFNNFLKTAKIR
jgi:hypothetical protein